MGSTCDMCGREPRDDGDPEIGNGPCVPPGAYDDPDNLARAREWAGLCPRCGRRGLSMLKTMRLRYKVLGNDIAQFDLTGDALGAMLEMLRARGVMVEHRRVSDGPYLAGVIDLRVRTLSPDPQPLPCELADAPPARRAYWDLPLAGQVEAQLAAMRLVLGELGAGERLVAGDTMVLKGKCPVCGGDLEAERGPGVIGKVTIGCVGCELRVLA